MFEAEPVVFAERCARLGRTVTAGCGAAGHVTTAVRRRRVGREGPGSGIALGHPALCARRDAGGKWDDGRGRDGALPKAMTQTRADRMHAVLTQHLSPLRIEVVDESSQHAGHAGAAAGGQTHYSVLIVTDRFTGLSRVARHRLVTGALAAEFEGGLHALSLTLRTPAEQAGPTA